MQLLVSWIIDHPDAVSEEEVKDTWSRYIEIAASMVVLARMERYTYNASSMC